MIYLELFIGFLTVGLFSFGGAYAAIPLTKDVVLHYGWISEEMLIDMIAVSESTPGPFMVNLATYVGSTKGGIPGALIATFAAILPAFLIILLVMVLLKRLLENRYVKAGMDGIVPCVVGIITATGCHMLIKNGILPAFGTSRDLRAPVIAAVLALIYFGSRKILKKGISPILLIVIAACLGVGVYGIK